METVSTSEPSPFDDLYTGLRRNFETPIILQAEVVHGFKRGSKELGVPTANLSMDELGIVGAGLETGIYFGWSLLKGVVYKSVISVGWNPCFENTKKTVEAHLLCQLDDFYGDTIRVALCGYLRDEFKFKSLDDLIACIQQDIRLSIVHLDEGGNRRLFDPDQWPTPPDNTLPIEQLPSLSSA